MIEFNVIIRSLQVDIRLRSVTKNTSDKIIHICSPFLLPVAELGNCGMYTKAFYNTYALCYDNPDISTKSTYIPRFLSMPVGASLAHPAYCFGTPSSLAPTWRGMTFNKHRASMIFALGIHSLSFTCPKSVGPPAYVRVRFFEKIVPRFGLLLRGSF